MYVSESGNVLKKKKQKKHVHIHFYAHPNITIPSSGLDFYLNWTQICWTILKSQIISGSCFGSF